MDDRFRDAVLRAAHTALVDDDASEEERQALADELSDAWPPEVPDMPVQVLTRQMDPELRDELRSEGIPDDQVLPFGLRAGAPGALRRAVPAGLTPPRQARPPR